MGGNSTLRMEQEQPQSSPQTHRSRVSLLLNYRDAPEYRVMAMGFVVLVCLICILVWNWRRHKISKDNKLGFIQSKLPMFTDTFLLLWGLGSGYGIIFAIKSPFYEIGQISTSVGIVFKGVGAILIGFIIGFIHVYYESEMHYRTVKKSLSEMKLRTFDFDRPKIIKCNFKDMFLVFWSLGSGYGIIFAIESWTYEIFGLKSVAAFWIKPYVAILVGFVIGCVHFYYDVIQSRILDTMTYSVVNENKISDIETDFDENETDSDGDASDDMEPTAMLSDIVSLERTATIDEFEEMKSVKNGRLYRSKTGKKKEKRSIRISTM